jgi:hypothetical protein
VLDSLRPWASGSTYLLMADDKVAERHGWPESTWQRLAAIRAAVDPNGLFVAPHPATDQD